MKWLRSPALGWRFGERLTLCSPTPSSIQLSLQFPRLLPSGVQEWAVAHQTLPLSPANGTSRTEAGRVGCSEVRGSKQTRAAADAGERRSVTSVATLTISSSAHQSLMALRCLRAEEKQREMFTINYSLCCSTDGNLQCWYDYYERVLKYHTDFSELKLQFHYSSYWLTLYLHTYSCNSVTPHIYITVYQCQYNSCNVIEWMCSYVTRPLHCNQYPIKTQPHYHTIKPVK